jgi:holo-[acyl-carrier protein] synthase
MIRGVGIDLVSVARFGQALKRWGPRLQQRLFTEDELRYCEGRVDVEQCLAGCFSAKEAFLKAMGTGLAKGIKWRDIQVIRKRGGPPSVSLQGEALRRFNEMGLRAIWLSISHDGGFCVAAVVIE